MVTPLLWAALQIVSGSPVGPPVLETPTVLDVPAVGLLVQTESPSPGLSAIRVFVPVSERRGEAGWGLVLTQLAAERVRGLAASTGARFSASRAKGGIAYVVTGSDLDIDHLFSVVARALSAPKDGRIAIQRAVSLLLNDLEAFDETGRGWITARLAVELCPTSTPWTGARADLEGMGEVDIEGFWGATHAPGGLVVTVATSLSQPVVLSGLDLVAKQLLGNSNSAERATSTRVSEAPAGAPGVIRRWYGEARAFPAGDLAVAHVVAELLAGSLVPQSSGYELFVEVRELGCSPALVAVGSSFRISTGELRTRVTSVVDELSAGIDATRVAEATASVYLRLLAAADAPAGRAALAASSFEGQAGIRDLDALRAIRLEDVTALLDLLRTGESVRAEIGS